MEGIFKDKIISFTKSKTLSRRTIISKAIKGNDSAFLELIKDNKEYLYKTAFLYVKNETDALEIIDETVYKAYRNIKNLKNPDYFKTWITRILINASLDKLKKTRKEDISDNMETFIEGKSEILLEEKIDLHNALELLNSNYKTALILKYYNCLSLEEIADIMECPLTSVKNYLHRGKKTLESILKEDYLNER